MLLVGGRGNRKLECDLDGKVTCSALCPTEFTWCLVGWMGQMGITESKERMLQEDRRVLVASPWDRAVPPVQTLLVGTPAVVPFSPGCSLRGSSDTRGAVSSRCGTGHAANRAFSSF